MTTRYFWAILLFAFGLRLYLTLTHDGFLGIDGGAYLLIRNEVLGQETTGVSFPKPPLAPGWLLVPFTSLWGDDVGYKVFSATFGVVPILPAFYLLARLFLSQTWALLAMLTLSLDLMHGEMLVTGVIPLIGFGLMAWVFWGILGMRRADPTTNPLHYYPAVIIGLPLLAFVNQTASGMMLIFLPVFLLTLWWRDRELPPRVVVPFLLGGALTLTALPWYLAVLPVGGEMRHPGALVYLDNVGSIGLAQFMVTVALVAGLWVSALLRDPPRAALATIMVVAGGFALLLSFDEAVINVFYRSRYFLAIPFYVLVWVLVRQIVGTWAKRELAAILIPAMMALMLVGYVYQFNNQAGYSATATPDVVRALDQVEGGGIVTNTYSLALWIAALERVPVAWTHVSAPPRTQIERDRHVRCVLGWVEGCQPFDAAEKLNVGYVLVDHRYPILSTRKTTDSTLKVWSVPFLRAEWTPRTYGAPDNGWEATAQSPWLEEIYRSGPVTLWRIDTESLGRQPNF